MCGEIKILATELLLLTKCNFIIRPITQGQNHLKKEQCPPCKMPSVRSCYVANAKSVVSTVVSVAAI